MRRAWEEYEKDTLIELRAQGIRYEDIGEVLDRTVASVENQVRKLIKEGKIEVKSQLWSPEEERRMLLLRSQGRTNGEIGKALGRTQASVEGKAKALIEAGVLDRPETPIKDFLTALPEAGWILVDIELAELAGAEHDTQVNLWRRKWKKPKPLTKLHRETLARIYRMGSVSCMDLMDIEEKSYRAIWDRLQRMVERGLVVKQPGVPDTYAPAPGAPSAEALAEAEALKSR